LSLAKKGAKGEKIAFIGENILVLDPSFGSVYLLGKTDRSAKVFAGEFAKSKLLTASSDKAYFLSDVGIFEFDSVTGQVKKILEKDSVWGKIADVFFYNGNLYLLDSQKNQIWKYPGGAGGFGSIMPYIKEASTDLSKSTSLAVDGVIWVLTQDKGILKILPDTIESIDVNGLDKPFSYPSVLRTQSEYKNIYVLDKGNKRLVVLNKEGEYDSQYQADFLAGAQDFAVDEKTGDIFVLSSPKIYQIKIQ